MNQYLDSLQKIKNYSPNTIKSYRNDIQQYLNEDIILGEFAKYLKICSKKEYTKSTINRKITSIKTFLNWCIEKKYFDIDGMFDLFRILSVGFFYIFEFFQPGEMRRVDFWRLTVGCVCDIFRVSMPVSGQAHSSIMGQSS